MRKKSVRLTLLLSLSALLLVIGRPDETIAGQTGPDAVWILSRIGEAPVDTGITIRFPQPGRVAGAGPCNRYAADQTAPLPWFALGPVRVTERACPALQLALETGYLELLGRMEFAELQGDTLRLTDGDGAALTYRRAAL